MNKIGIYNETGEKLPCLKTAKKVLKKAIQIEKLKQIECNLIMIDDSRIHELNREYRQIDRPTDVITFALEDEKECQAPTDKRILGDIYISIETARRQAKDYGHSLEREVSFLTVHGFYHLLGYDHQIKEEAKVMMEKQEEVLRRYGIKR